MTRDEIENKSLNELLDIINNKYGKTRGNDLVAREAFRICSKNIFIMVRISVFFRFKQSFF